MGSGAVLVVGPVVAAVVLVGARLWWRGWWRRGSSRVAQVVQATVAPRLFPARHLDLLDLQRRLVAAGLTAVSVSVTGEQRLPARIPIEASPNDLRRLAAQLDGGLDQLRLDLGSELSRRGDRLGYTVPPELTVELLSSPFVVEGRPRLARPSEVPAARPAPGPPVARSEPPSVPTDTVLMGTVHLVRAWLEPVGGGDPVTLEGRRTTVGRREADVTVDHPAVSATHAELACDRGRWSVEDRRSTNGTWVNGSPVDRRDLDDGDRVRFAPDGPEFVFRLGSEGDDPAVGGDTADGATPPDCTVLSMRRRGVRIDTGPGRASAADGAR